MFFSKSFGYAVRGVLYIALMHDEKRRVQTDEIAERLRVPKHFMGKILKKLAKENILSSVKGPYGGFSITEKTLSTSLSQLIEITNGGEIFNVCTLQMKECNSLHPCPIHNKMESVKEQLIFFLSATTIADLLRGNKNDFIKSISTDFLTNAGTKPKNRKG